MRARQVALDSISGALSLLGDISPAQITANQTDYNPTGLATASVLRLSTDASRNIFSLATGSDGRVVSIVNVGAFDIVLKDDDGATGTAAMRFALLGDTTLAPDETITLLYDSTSSRWRAYQAADASATVAGVVELATNAEAITGTDAVRAVTPAALFAANSGYTTTATAAGTTTLTVSSNPQQFFTGSSAQNCDMPVASTLQLGQSWVIVNNSTGILTVRSSGGNTIVTLPGGCQATITCILTSGTTAASWNVGLVTGSGTYTPALTNVTNVAASQNYVCQWMRVGSVVTVSGRFDIDPTAAAPTATELGISLPIASNFAALEDCAGVASARTVTDASAAITADATNDRAKVEYLTSNLNNHAMVFTFTYRII